MSSFISEFNPVSHSTANTAAKSSGSPGLINERILYRKATAKKLMLKSLLW
ncbi:DUF4756 family protein [Yokenella regensburgei]|uniref:DUF4756 family protein n=1 Tax=Yokenella regensburgei TaxID=158877 RepID=UPI003F5CC8F4